MDTRKLKMTITVDETQARVIMNALEFYTRMRLGQFDNAIADLFLFRRKWNWEQFNYHALRLKNTVFPELSENASYGIYNKEVGEWAQISWDIHQVIRHDLSWFLYPDGGMTVNFDKPMNTSEHKLPLVEITEEKS
jgi:hypothetical protein